MHVLHFLLEDFGEGCYLLLLLLLVVTGGKQSQLLLRPTEVQLGLQVWSGVWQHLAKIILSLACQILKTVWRLAVRYGKYMKCVWVVFWCCLDKVWMIYRILIKNYVSEHGIPPLFFSEGYRRYLALGLTSFVRSWVSVFAFLFFCLNDQAFNCLIHF